MTGKLVLSGLLLGVLLVSHAKAGIIEISAHGNNSKQRASQLKINSDTSAETVQAINRTKPNDTIYIVYPQQPSNRAVTSGRSVPGETLYIILKDKHGNQKGYQYPKPNDTSFGTFNSNSTPAPPASSPPAISPIQLPPIIAKQTSAPAPPSSPVVTISPIQLPPKIAGPPTQTPALISPIQLPPIIAVPSTTPIEPSDPNTNSAAAASLDASPAIPSTDPNLFAPNIHSHYPSQSANSGTRFNGGTSYLPPPAGPVADEFSRDSSNSELPLIIAGPTPLLLTTTEERSDPTKNPPPIQHIQSSDPHLFAPNIHSHYPPPPVSGGTRIDAVTSYLPPAAGQAEDGSSANSNLPDAPPNDQYIPPAELFQFPPNIHAHYHSPPVGSNFHTTGITSYLPPPAGPTDTLSKISKRNT